MIYDRDECIPTTIEKMDDEQIEMAKESLRFNRTSFATVPIEVIGAFEVYVLNNNEWIKLTRCNLKDYITLYEYDEGGQIIDTNQEEIRKHMTSIINSIKNNGTVLPTSYKYDEMVLDTFYLNNASNAILKISAIEEEIEVFVKI